MITKDYLFNHIIRQYSDDDIKKLINKLHKHLSEKTIVEMKEKRNKSFNEALNHAQGLLNNDVEGTIIDIIY